MHKEDHCRYGKCIIKMSNGEYNDVYCFTSIIKIGYTQSLMLYFGT